MANAEPKLVATGADIFAMPVNYDLGTACDGRMTFRGDPDFRDGLIARYFMKNVVGHSPDQSAHDLAQDPVILSSTRVDGEDLTVASDPNVIRTHDDLIKRFYKVCFYASRELHLVRIDYFRATDAEKRHSPISEPLEGWIRSVEFGVGDYSFLPGPVPGGVVEFRWPAIYSGSEWLRVAPVLGNGLNAAFALEGPAADWSRDGYRGKVERLMEQGFVVIEADLNGKTATIIIDPTILHTRQKLEERAEVVRALDDAGSGEDLRLQKIVYYPATRGGLDDLRLPGTVLRGIGDQTSRIRQARLARLKEMAEKPPERYEVEEMLKQGWAHPAGDVSAPGHDVLWSASGSAFGEINDMKCIRKRDVFSCHIGVTFLLEGKPKYRQSGINLKRDADHQFKQMQFDEEIILISKRRASDRGRRMTG